MLFIRRLWYKDFKSWGSFGHWCIDWYAVFFFIDAINHLTNQSSCHNYHFDQKQLTNDVENISHSDRGILVTDFTGHHPVFHIHKISNYNYWIISYEGDFHYDKRHAFREVIAETDWFQIYSGTSTELISVLSIKIKWISLKCVPQTTVKRKYHYREPWLPDALRIPIK